MDLFIDGTGNLFLWLLVIFIVLIILRSIFKKKKKSKENKRNLIFNKNIEDALQACAEGKNTNYYHDIVYKALIGKFVSKNMDEKLKNIPNLKKQYSISLEKLELIINNNSVFSEEDALDLLENKLSRQDFSNKISKDIIEVLPLLADYFDAYQQLKEDIYNYLFDIIKAYNNLWRSLHKSNRTAIDQETINLAKGLALESYNLFMTSYVWKSLKTVYPQYDNEIDQAAYMQIITSNTNNQNKWISIWPSEMEKVASKYEYDLLFLDLHNFFDAIDKKYENIPQLFTLCKFGKTFFKSHVLHIASEDFNKKDLLRIKDLYTSKKMNGAYDYLRDPKHQ